MQKAIIILPSNENDKTAWSGTNYHIFYCLKKFYDLRYLNFNDYQIKNKFILHLNGLYIRIINIIFRQKCKENSLWFNKLRSRKIVKQINKSDCELVFTTIRNLTPFIKSKKVVYITDAIVKSMINYYWFNLPRRDIKVANKIQYRALKNAYKVIVSSDWTKNEINKENAKFHNKTYVVPFGANLEKTETPNKIISEKINLLFCGADTDRKGLSFACEVLKMLNKMLTNGQKAELNVIGASKKNDNGIIYHGLLNKNNMNDLDKIKQLYQKSHFFILPTKAECAGIVFCEAMMYGLPIISCNTGGVSTYVKNNYNGYLLDLNDNFVINAANKILNLIKNESKYKTISEKCISLYNDVYNWDSWAESVYKIINS